MKKSLLIILTATLTNAFAQIPNAGFEQVTTTTGFCNTGGAPMTTPTNYATTVSPTATTSISHSGSKAAMIASVGAQASSLITYDCIAFQPYITYTGIVPGSMTAWVRRAASLTNDTLTITVAVYDNATTAIAGGQLVIKGSGYTSYTQVTIPMTVVGTGIPAKLEILFSGSAVSGSSWYVDDLAFAAVGIATYGKDNFTMYYNSNNSAIEIKASNEENIFVCVYDVVGKKVLETPYLQMQNGNSTEVNTQGFQSGIYLVQILDKTGVLSTKRIVIQ